MLPSRRWWDLTTADFAAIVMENVVSIQPVAAVEQHGPHLPVAVDASINAGILDEALALLPDNVPVLVLPALPVGKSNEHLAFPGTLSVSYETQGNYGSISARASTALAAARSSFLIRTAASPSLSTSSAVSCEYASICLPLPAHGSRRSTSVTYSTYAKGRTAFTAARSRPA